MGGRRSDFVADAHRDDGKRFVERAEENLSADERLIALDQRSVDDYLFSDVGNLMIFVSSSASASHFARNDSIAS